MWRVLARERVVDALYLDPNCDHWLGSRADALRKEARDAEPHKTQST